MTWPLLLLLAPVTGEAPRTGPVEHLHTRVVEAIRNCPVAGPGEVAICARDRGVAEAWRLPRLDPRYAARKPDALGGVLAAGDGSAAGAGACSAAGAGGFTGCQLKLDHDWGRWKAEQQADGRPFPW